MRDSWIVILCLLSISIFAQTEWDKDISRVLPSVLIEHRAFVSIPNVPIIEADIYKNVEYAKRAFESKGFSVELLESESLPVFFAEKVINKDAKTVLYYFHLDGQPASADNWDQEHPFVPVLKEKDSGGNWKTIDWARLDKEPIDPEWRIFGRAAADDKGPITMMLTALDLLQQKEKEVSHNIKIILDLQEESGSHGFLSTLELYKERYASDYFLIMDGPANSSNRPTLTFGCRGIATCSITVFGAKTPQHSGHYGNYAPNPVFTLSHLLASMKDEHGKVTIQDYYNGITISEEERKILSDVPDEENQIIKELGIQKADAVGHSYQESLQYPSLNVRHIETPWKGPGLKTIIPESITVHLDVRLVAETPADQQIRKIKDHIASQGFLVLDRDPTDEERLNHHKIAKFQYDRGINAFRTNIDTPIGEQLVKTMTQTFNKEPVIIRTMGGTVPIIPAVNTLQIPAVIIPMVNMDNNQHNPNENLRIGNMTQGIKICLALLTMDLTDVSP